MPASVVEEIVERALKLHCRSEDDNLVRFLMKLKRASSPFQLLDSEKSRVLSTYEKLIHARTSASDPLLSA